MSPPRALKSLVLALPLALAAACATAPRAGASAAAAPELALAESWPQETRLDHADIADAQDVWPRMFAGAKRTLDVAEFYLVSHDGSALDRSIQALEAAAARGVKVRVLAEEKFARTYPELLDRWSQRPGITVRKWPAGRDLGGGVLHAKYFVVDGREAYLGSQNFDWRSLEHIQELGLRVAVPAVVRALQDTFDLDWALAGGEPAPAAQAPTAEWSEARFGGEPVRIKPVVSPEKFVPASASWDLPELVRLIDSAKRTVRVQLLTYRMTGRDGERFAPLEDALLRAAARGVKVELALADWCKRKGTIEGLQALHDPAKGITLKLVTIPPYSGGFISFARVIHAKYLVVDGERAWVGTSNWERDYFHASRNVGVIVEGGALAQRLDGFFTDLFEGPYAFLVDKNAKYTPPQFASPDGK